ncbi:MAG: YidC/Oxa1 family membrane protein insertase [Candidatus Geothermincolia bacterium]
MFVTASIWSQIWNGLLSGLNFVLQGIYDITGNYGIAIILLTVLVKAVLLPLTWKQTKSMIALQRLQPEMKKLQEKYKNDRERLGQETMKFYKEHKVNPLAGCLPLLLQMPVFIALYEVLRKYVITPPSMLIGNAYLSGTNLVNSSSGYFLKSLRFLWIENLSEATQSADPFFILIVLMAATTWYSQKQVMSDPRQKSMLFIMPAMMAFIALRLPAGVVLYWIVTNGLQIVQQYAVQRSDKRTAPPEPVKGKGGQKPQPGSLFPTKGKGALPGETKDAGAKPAGKGKARPGPGTTAGGGAKPAPKGPGKADVRKPKPKPAGTTGTTAQPKQSSRSPQASKKGKKKGGKR